MRQLTAAIDGAGVIGLIGLVGFLYAGLRTMDKLRIGMELIWKGQVDEPDVLRDNLQDLARAGRARRHRAGQPGAHRRA